VCELHIHTYHKGLLSLTHSAQLPSPVSSSLSLSFPRHSLRYQHELTALRTHALLLHIEPPLVSSKHSSVLTPLPCAHFFLFSPSLRRRASPPPAVMRHLVLLATLVFIELDAAPNRTLLFRGRGHVSVYIHSPTSYSLSHALFHTRVTRLSHRFSSLRPLCVLCVARIMRALVPMFGILSQYMQPLNSSHVFIPFHSTAELHARMSRDVCLRVVADLPLLLHAASPCFAFLLCYFYTVLSCVASLYRAFCFKLVAFPAFAASSRLLPFAPLRTPHSCLPIALVCVCSVYELVCMHASALPVVSTHYTYAQTQFVRAHRSVGVLMSHHHSVC
jgi:hypothetical protein